MKENLVKYFAMLVFSLILISAITKITSIAEAIESISFRSDLIEFKNELIESNLIPRSFDKNDPLLLERKILISSEVNEALQQDITKKLIYLDQLNHKPIDLYITTYGGWAISAFGIIEAMNMIESPVNTTALGLCYSSGAIILACGTGERSATENSIIMVHANVDTSENVLDGDYHYQRLYEGMWKKNSNLPEEWFPMTRDMSYYFDADTALKYGVIDNIIKMEKTQKSTPEIK